MSFVACSVDAARCIEKPATVYWAWFDVEGSRHAYKQILCIAHFIERVLPLEVASHDNAGACPVCGIDTADDVDGNYCTIYAPGLGVVKLELATCPPCAARTRIAAQEGSRRLEDRSLGASLQAPNPSGTQVWAALGLRPNA